jgi:hypothetical protein
VKGPTRRPEKLIAEALPGRRVVQLRLDTIAKGGGGIHRTTRQEPSGLQPAELQEESTLRPIPGRVRGRTPGDVGWSMIGRGVSTRECGGTSQPDSVEQMSSRELTCSAERRVDDSAMWMYGRRGHSPRVPNTASPSACLPRPSTSRRGRPEIGSRDESFGLFSARWRSSQTPCRPCVRTCRSTSGCRGTSRPVSVEQMSSRELICDSGST